jgi:hypothetical protein
VYDGEIRQIRVPYDFWTVGDDGFITKTNGLNENTKVIPFAWEILCPYINGVPLWTDTDSLFRPTAFWDINNPPPINAAGDPAWTAGDITTVPVTFKYLEEEFESVRYKYMDYVVFWDRLAKFQPRSFVYVSPTDMRVIEDRTVIGSNPV